jgi:putative ABC transport system permease protein
MRHVIVRGFLGRKLRSALTALAIVLGVAMIVGSSVLTAQIKGAFNGIFDEVRKHTDVVVTKKAEFKDQNGQTTVPFSTSVLSAVQSVPGVEKAAGAVGSVGVVPVVTENGTLKPIKSTGGAPSLGNSLTPAPFNPTTIISGRQPEASGEISMEKRTADRANAKVGDRIQLATSTGLHPVTVVGIYTFPGSFGGATQVLTTLQDAQTWFEREGQFDEIVVKAAPGVSQTELRKRIQQALPQMIVRTGPEQAKQESADIAGFVDILGYALTTIGVISTIAGMFIIFITFWITVGQRVKELALLRTLGASRRQVLVSVILEAALVGALASLLGIVVGLGIAKAIGALFDAVGFGLPVAALHLSPGVAIGAFIVGMIATLLASLAPAIKSTRIQPVEALREGAVPPPGWFVRNGKWLAPVVAVIGLAVIGYGLFLADGTAAVLLSLGAGALTVLVGVVLTAPYVVPYLARIIGWPGERLGGIPGRIARENAERNPFRTALTSAALMLGILLVCFVAVFAASLKKSITDVLGSDIRAQLFVSAGGVFGNQQSALQPSMAEQIAAVPGVKSVSPTSFLSAKFQPSNSDVAVSSAAPGFVDAYRLRWINGADDTIRNLAPDQAVIDQDTAKSKHLSVGSPVDIVTREGKRAAFKIAGIVKTSNLVSGLMISPTAFAPLGENKGVAFMFVVTDPNADVKQVQDAVQAVALKANPLAEVQSNQDVIDQASTSINNVVIPLYALLGVIVLISIIGIVNVLLLSVFERTREIGLLRAVGTTRRQVRRVVRYESVITAMIGATLGVIVGTVFGVMVVSRLNSLPFALPIGQIIAFFIVAVIAGLLAAIIPARRAARLNVLEALQYE